MKPSVSRKEMIEFEDSLEGRQWDVYVQILKEVGDEMFEYGRTCASRNRPKVNETAHFLSRETKEPTP